MQRSSKGKLREAEEALCDRDERTAAENSGTALSRYTDLPAAAIIDPTTVVRVALENTVSDAGSVLLTEATMTGLPEKRAESAAASAPEPD